MIVCGTDHSPHAAEAADVATALAVRLGAPLRLVHVVADERDRSGEAGAERRLRLQAETKRLARPGLALSSELLAGPPDEAIVELAGREGARLVVISALGFRKASKWLLGSVAERTVQTSTTPVLVVRAGERLAAWARGEGPLRLVVAADLSSATEQSLRWAAGLRAAGPCEVSVVHVYWPPDEYKRLGLRAKAGFFEEHPEIERILVRDLTGRVSAVLGDDGARVVVRSAFGRPADSLVKLAAELQADLLVVGARQRKGLSRLWHGSFSHDVLGLAPMNVACLPLPALAGREREREPGAEAESIPTFRSVLAATDLSELGNRSVAYAYALLAGGGVIHLLHVVDRSALPDPLYPHYMPDRAPTADERRLQEQELEEGLRSLVPAAAAGRGVETRPLVVDAPDVAQAIYQAAERLGVDAICLASHGRGGVTQLVSGSVAKGVLERTRRPVLVVRPPPGA